jgi:hypothetical protein
MAMGNALALQVSTPQINTVANFQQSQANASQLKSQRMAQEAAELEKWAQVGLGIMGGNPDGEIDQNALGQFVEMAGNDPLALKLKENPDLIRTITKGSLSVLSNARDEARFELAKKQFELQLAEAQKPKETTDITEYNFAVNNGYEGSFEDWKNSDGGVGTDGETFAMQPTYYKVTDPQTGKTSIQFGQLGNKGTFKPTALPDGAEPAIPVTQLNTETAFIPKDKFGGTPDDAAPTPIDNQGAAYDTGIGKGQAELDVTKPEKARKAGAALQSLVRQTGIVAQDIDKAIEAADNNTLFTTGFLGDLSKAVPGTPAYDLAQTLLTIQANIGFDRLQEMRNNSPTGGALGSITEKETALLQAVNGATAQGQSAEQFKANLQRIKQLQAEVLAERKAAYAQDFGGEAPAAAPAAATESGTDDTVVDWTEYDWGD